MGKSRLVQAVAFSTLISLSSACAYNQPKPYIYNYNEPRAEQIQKPEVQEPKQKSGFRKFAEGAAYITIQGLSIAQYFIL